MKREDRVSRCRSPTGRSAATTVRPMPSRSERIRRRAPACTRSGKPTRRPTPAANPGATALRISSMSDTAPLASSYRPVVHAKCHRIENIVSAPIGRRRYVRGAGIRRAADAGGRERRVSRSPRACPGRPASAETPRSTQRPSRSGSRDSPIPRRQGPRHASDGRGYV